jgi:hypothetical protein
LDCYRCIGSIGFANFAAYRTSATTQGSTNVGQSASWPLPGWSAAFSLHDLIAKKGWLAEDACGSRGMSLWYFLRFPPSPTSLDCAGWQRVAIGGSCRKQPKEIAECRPASGAHSRRQSGATIAASSGTMSKRKRCSRVRRPHRTGAPSVGAQLSIRIARPHRVSKGSLVIEKPAFT